MHLDDAQRKKVAEWIAQGLKLSDIQSRLASELGVRMTYMDVRLLVDDLKLTPKDVAPSKPIQTTLSAGGASPVATTRPATAKPGPAVAKPAAPAGKPAGVSVALDQIARPGAV